MFTQHTQEHDTVQVQPHLHGHLMFLILLKHLPQEAERLFPVLYKAII